MFCFSGIYLIKKFLQWFFVKRIARNEVALQQLITRREEIVSSVTLLVMCRSKVKLVFIFQLEEVMENETFKKAKDILQRFDPEKLKSFQLNVNTTQSQ